MVGQKLSGAFADEANAQGEDQPTQARLLTALDFLQEIARRLFPHPLQVRQLLVGQAVEIRNVVHQFLVHQLVDQGFTQAIDIHSPATGEEQQRLSKPGRAGRLMQR